eukprot:5463865-Pyramimonas_sp.AAC.1
MWETHAACATGAFGGAPCGATKYWVSEAHAGCATGTLGEAPYGVTKRSAPRKAVLGVGDACGLRHSDLRWSS